MPLSLGYSPRLSWFHCSRDLSALLRSFVFRAPPLAPPPWPLSFDRRAAAPQPDQARATANDANDLRLCPKCGGPMMVIERLTAAQVQLRSPPVLVTAAA